MRDNDFEKETFLPQMTADRMIEKIVCQKNTIEVLDFDFALENFIISIECFLNAISTAMAN